MDNLDRKLAIMSLFESQGYKLFKEELDALLVADDIHIENNSRTAIKGYVLNWLNGHRQGIREVNYILESFKQELDESADGR